MVRVMLVVALMLMVMAVVRAVYLQALPSGGAQSGVRNVMSTLV